LLDDRGADRACPVCRESFRRSGYLLSNPLRGQRIVDLGCGPGFYVAELLEEVGPTGWVVGVDASPQTLALARRRTEGHDNVALYQADVTGAAPSELLGRDATPFTRELVDGALVPGGRPLIDVWPILQGASLGVVQGRNPYAMTFASI
jgi:SAM-dependent methyltransferase